MNKLKFLFVLMLVALIGTVALAQEDVPPGDYEALAERVIAASEQAENYPSFAVEKTVTENQSITVALGEIEQNIVSNLERTTTATVTLGDTPSGQGTIVVTASASDPSGEYSYVLEAEVRYVDSVLYVSAAYTESEGDVPLLPEGWVAVDDPVFSSEFSALDLEGFLDWFDPDEEDTDNPLDMLSDLLETATSVTIEETDMDGTPIESIAITLGWEGLQAILSISGDFSADDPVMGLFADAMAEEDELVQMAVALDEDDNLVGLAFGFVLSLVDADASLIDASLEGGTINAQIENTEVNKITQIGEAFEAVEAPQM